MLQCQLDVYESPQSLKLILLAYCLPLLERQKCILCFQLFSFLTALNQSISTVLNPTPSFQHNECACQIIQLYNLLNSSLL